MIPALKAFQIVLEDPETILFIRRTFALPEEHPQITSRKWLSKNDSGYIWNVELMEKRLSLLKRKLELINVALVEVDPATGQITNRHFLANILMVEYKEYITRSLGDLCSEGPLNRQLFSRQKNAAKRKAKSS